MKKSLHRHAGKKSPFHLFTRKTQEKTVTMSSDGPVTKTEETKKTSPPAKP